MDSLVKQVRECLLFNCFYVSHDLPVLEKLTNLTKDDIRCTVQSKAAPSEEYADDSYNYECQRCNEYTLFSSAKMLPDDRYKELCLTDKCIKREIEVYIKANKCDTDV